MQWLLRFLQFLKKLYFFIQIHVVFGKESAELSEEERKELDLNPNYKEDSEKEDSHEF